MSRHKGPKRAPRQPGKIDGPWEPSAKQLEWYRQWTEESKSLAEIGRESKPPVTRQTVHEAVHRVAEYLRLMCHDQIMSFRDRQTAQHEMVMGRALQAWNDSIGEMVTVTECDTDSSKARTTKREFCHGNPAYLRIFMDAAEKIRDIWGVNMPFKSAVAIRHAEEIEGLPGGLAFECRSEAMLAGAEAIRLAALNLEEAERKVLGNS